ncbi:MAG: iron complex transport system substrate-binding protein [Flavobacteriaceae bacterium]|jgi:iron complex transport system substrate-binding protein|uniref:ABC transporter substrate-binding protein n=1 Tax=Candidatus Marifrigoribacter sp. Uisw_064 TaxID=3230970 RepID=UPI003ADE1E1D
MQKIYFLLIVFIFISCKTENKKEINTSASEKQIQSVDYAKGFDIQHHENYKVLNVKNAWPGSEKIFSYAIINKGVTLDNPDDYDAVIEIPLNSIVVTSTTHIPSLEMLGVSEKLIGFPNLEYISSPFTRKRINNGEIKELGNNEDINTEILIELNPDIVIGFGIDGNNKSLNTISNTGIPVLYNGDWTETSPLGKAEWIKFFGVLFDKEKEADRIFSDIEAKYSEAKKIAQQAKETPTVLSGAMFKDIWYLPQGQSWVAQFIEDANGDYLWKDSEGTGSLSLNLENVLVKGQQAEFWIAPGYFNSKQQMTENHSVYGNFDAFKNDNIFSFANKKGETGGVLYYELGPNRPDIILKDLIKVLHPELLPDHNLYFFDKIE